MSNKVNVVTAAALLLLAALVLTVHGAPASNPDGDIKIVTQNQIQDEKSYRLEFENSDGQKRSEAGEVREESEGGIVVRGQYSYVDPVARKLYTVRYEAGNFGYRPTVSVTDI